MKAERKTKEQLIKELEKLQRRINKLEAEEIKVKNATSALKESEIRFRNIFESSKDGIIFFDGKTQKIILGNKAMAKLLGCSKKELVGRSISSLHPPKEWPVIEKEFQKHVKGEISVSPGIPVLRKDGSVFYADISSSLITLKGKSYFSAFFCDITERKRAEEALIESREQYRSLASAEDSMYLVDKESRFLFMNDAHLSRLGLSLDEVAGKPYSDFHSPEDTQLFKAPLEKTFRTNRSCQVEHHSERDHKFFLRTFSPVRDAQGSITAVTVISKDITNHKRAEKDLQESEENFRNLAESANDGIMITLGDGTWAFANKRASEITGYSLPDLLKKGIRDLVISDDVRKVKERYRKRMADEFVPSQYEISIRHKGGKIIPSEITAAKTVWQGRPANLIIFRDISERKRVEEALRESEEKYRNLIERANDGIGIGQDGVIRFANARLADMVGYSIEELVGSPFIGYFMPDEVPKAIDSFKRRMDGEDIPAIYEMALRHKDGSRIDVELNAGIINYKGKPADLVMIRDITKRKRAEEELRESEARLKAQYQGSPIPTFTWQKKGETFELVDFNPAAQVATEGEAKKYLGKTATEMYQDRQEILQDIHRCFTEKKVIKRELQSQHFMPGRTIVATYAFVPPDLIMVHAEDITERMQNQKALQISEERFRIAAEGSNDFIYEWDLNTGQLEWFGAATERLNHIFSEPPVTTAAFEKSIHPEDNERISKAVRRQVRYGEPYRQEYRLIGKTGDIFHIQTAGKCLRDEDGWAYKWIGTTSDITARKQAEEALFQAEEKYRAIVENAVEGIFQTTNDGKFLMANNAVAKFHGYDSPEELIADISDIGKQLYVHPEDRQRYRRLLADEGVVKGFENQYYRKDGTINWGSMNVRSVRDNEGRILYYEGTIEDITARKEAEEGLQKSLEKLRKALGGIVQAMSLTVESRDPYTAGHQRRVADLARAIAQEMGLPEDQVDALRMAGNLHDLGKISIPAEILSRPNQLSDIEFSLIKGHPQISYDILKDIDFNWPVAQIVLQHHERINGSGYPLGLSGEAIYLEARILAVADVVEAISSHRPYRPAYGIDVALEEIEKNKGELYDPKVVEACLKLFREKGFKFL